MKLEDYQEQPKTAQDNGANLPCLVRQGFEHIGAQRLDVLLCGEHWVLLAKRHLLSCSSPAHSVPPVFASKARTYGRGFCRAFQRSKPVCIASQSSAHVGSAAASRRAMSAVMPACPFKMRDKWRG